MAAGGRRRGHGYRTARGLRRVLRPAGGILCALHGQHPGHGDPRHPLPRVGQKRLDAVRTWIDTHRDQVIIVLSSLVGFWLIGKERISDGLMMREQREHRGHQRRHKRPPGRIMISSRSRLWCSRRSGHGRADLVPGDGGPPRNGFTRISRAVFAIADRLWSGHGGTRTGATTSVGCMHRSPWSVFRWSGC